MNGDSYPRDGGRSGGSRNYSSRDEHRSGGGDRGNDRRRRRSRSPRHSSRRDYEVDTYSSSRDYREREREDTYARRERRDDRAWGDSYSRRDNPRRDEERGDRGDRGDRGHGGRRGGDRGDRGGGDRDGFDDRRGRRDGGQGGGQGGGGGRDRRQKSASPPFQKKREATPDLKEFVSILVRPRRLKQWDIKPANYDMITAEQAKLSGMFPLPGAPRAAPMDPARLASFMNPAAGTATTSSLKTSNSKQAKRLFVYNIPDGTTSEQMMDFFNTQLNGLNVVSGPDPCASANMTSSNEYALLEFKTAEDATMALTMDGISIDGNTSGGPDRPGLSIRRPNNYITPTPDESEPVADEVLSEVKDGPNKLSIANIPLFVEEGQIRELVETFGALKAFVLVKENMSDTHRQVAFCEYRDADIVDAVIEGLNSIPLGDHILKVTRATVGVKQAVGIDGGVGAMTLLAGSTATEAQDRSRVVCLLNMVTHDDLLDSEEYEDIKESVAEECEKFGKIVEMKIPRPAGVRTNAGVGKIYIKFQESASAQKAIKALAGRRFDERTVVVTEFPEEAFEVDAW
ncbi:hypothetical protein K504DRAFT_460837 [Pleomassaria siparia CBS 279.74]|uniref:RRM domain-containing protein n=1 Tax=Pleomassaria siparia CBS 279.74 TaxID=1314801 RepID=A0A6G1JXW1_9PLEO|nr:hypothetical protein K504DRAFT_460837 [Pleomassaria siparia CBS 279.74]